ncbi:amino acid adenylation domain-containing protein [Streptomyces sp. NPDC006294]|uniref:amino acid adenylation domain-containing protein n=3 Tax=unclassified Streptomyces TaxID=2593676 RepID=UPI0036A0D2A1
MAEAQATPDIAVIGMAGRLPGADNLTEFWQNLRDGVESVTVFPDDELAGRVEPGLLEDPAYVRAGAVLDGIDRFDARFFGYSAREAALLDPQHRILLECAWHALEDAGHPEGGQGVGVYAGCSLSGYLLNNLLPGRRVDASAAGFELLIANDKDYLASRIGYKLGLEGPAVSVQTACSSSLVAVHLAAQALLAYECDLALAGGATVRVPHRVGYRFEEGMILSPDGHCRPFDAGANGTIGGSGAGVVVLKRLADALADGDRVDAVIKGSALTNDGSDKVGYTAPSVHGQAAAVAAALAVGNVDADTVTAIEAHGTGTPLGDPVEIAALTEAFRASTDRSGYCALGSVKANIGHLDSAAGISGLIKAVLQLKHRRLAPTVNFHVPNPRIDFATSPFFVNDRLRDWKSEGGTPLRIGVSSFGFGGTNAHVVLEEGPEPAHPAPPRRPVQLLTLSARTPDALDTSGAALTAALRSPDAADLADIAHTLHRGRRSFEYRRAVVGSDHDRTAERLGGQDAAYTANGRARGGAGIALLLPGQGSQYPGMGRELYDGEPGFRERVDTCADLLRPHLDRDLRDLLYPADTTPAALREAADALQRTAFAQPALFTVEYALAGLLADWGLRPDALLGHSVGEITAACLAGALPLPDAVRLVARRGALMQELEPGSMLSVALDEEALRAMLPEALTVAAVNAPSLCVVAGPVDAVDGFARELERQEIGHRRLHTSHAFHSPMVDPALPGLTEEGAGLALQEPDVPWLSNRTGDWITAADLADPGYWAGHARDTVRFGDGVRRLLERDDLLLVEVGPGRTLSTLARGADGALNRTIVPTLPGPGSDACAQEFLLAAVGRLWTAGAETDWEALDGTGRRRVALPGYPFQRRRHWIEAPASTGAEPASLDAVVEDDAEAEPVVHDSRPALSTAYQEPRGPREAAVAAIWEDLLGIAPVGVHDGFIELGGHSLLATQVVARIRSDLGVTVPMRELVRASTVAAVADLVARHGGAGDERPAEALPVAVADPDHLYEPFPLTEIQQAQWIGRMGNFTLGNVAAHIYWEVENTGIDLDALESAWNQLMRRHPMLNAVLTDDGRQRILPDPVRYAFDRVDLRDMPEAERVHRLDERRERLSHEMRPTDTWPLFGITAVLLPEDRTRLYLSFDLLIADIGSIRILLQEWRTLYADPTARLPEIGLSYRDYVLAAAQVRGTALHEKSLDHWRRRVAELPPAPELPLAVAPSELAEPRFTPRSHVLDRAAWQRVKDRAAAHGVTPSAVLLAAYATVLGRWSRSPRFTLNVTVINRIPVHPDADRLVGEFASFDLLPVDLERDTGIAAIARALQEHAWEDLEHRYVNGVDVLRELARQRGGTSGSVMPIVFTSTLVQDTGDQGETLFDWLGDLVHESVQTPQVWIDAAVLETSKGLYLSWPAVEELFPPGLVDEMFEAYCRLLAELAADEQVWSSGPGELAPAGHRALVAGVNGTGGPVPEGLLHAGLLERAVECPEKVAVVAADGVLTYGELRLRAAAVARRLLAEGLSPGELVAVSIGKSREQVLAALGVLMAGGAYLPVDPELPVERRHSLLERSGARVVLTSGREAPLGWPDGITEELVDLGGPVVEGPVPEVTGAAGDLAYVIYTSGSTGVPKGVAVSHRAALNTCVDVCERFGVGASDVVLGLSSLSFDLSVFDVFGVLGVGGTLVLPRAGSGRDPGHWLELVVEHGVTVWNSVPALMGMLVEQAGDAVQLPLELVLLSGDWIPVELPGRVRAVAPGARVVSLGGATEAGIWSIACPVGEVDPAWESIPYGRPLRNQRFHVLDAQWRECPVWVAGELFIAGTGLAEGYWRDPERTAVSFVTHPVTGERLYRTGDVGRWLPSGDIEFLGREDFQVKVGGFRIELGEIEAALAGCEGVRAAVAAAPGPRHHRRLVGYIVPGQPTAETELLERVRAHAERHLPGYMVPPVLKVINEIPLSANGKVDRTALPDPTTDTASAPKAARGAALGPTAAALSALAAEIIGIDGIDPHADFFTLGGDSIMGIQMVSRAGALGMDITAADLFRHRTIADLAAVVDERAAGVEAADDETLPLTPYQRDLFASAAPQTPTAAHRFAIPVAADFAPERAEELLALLWRRHPGLRMRFAQGTRGRHQIEEGRAEDTAHPVRYVPLIDLSALPAERRVSAMEQMADDMQEELDPLTGLTVKAALFDLGPEDRRLVWLSHALVTDLRSVQLLLSDFSAAAELLRDGRPADLLPPTRPFARWVRAAAEHTADDPAASEEPAPAPESDGEPVHRFSTVLDRDEAERLLGTAAAAYRLTGREVAIAALACAAFEATDRHSLRFAVEDDARPLNLADLDVSVSVGAFSRMLPVTLERHVPGKTKALLTAAKERLRAAVRDETLCTGDTASLLLLRDLDELAELPRVGYPFTPDGPVAPPVWDPGTAPGHPLVVTTYRLDGRWHIDWACRGGEARALAEDLADRTAGALRTLADHCAATDNGAVSPSDFPLADLDQAALAALAAALDDGAGPDGDGFSPNDGTDHEVNR